MLASSNIKTHHSHYSFSSCSLFCSLLFPLSGSNQLRRVPHHGHQPRGAVVRVGKGGRTVGVGQHGARRGKEPTPKLYDRYLILFYNILMYLDFRLSDFSTFRLFDLSTFRHFDISTLRLSYFSTSLLLYFSTSRLFSAP